MQVRRDYLAWTPAEREQKQDGAIVVPQHGIEAHQNLMNVTRQGPVTPPEPIKEEEPREKTAESTE